MLMLAVLLFGGGLGWYIAKARRQAETVAAIRRIGGDVTYDWEYRDGKDLGPNAKPPWPDWLIQQLGPDYFCNVTTVRISPLLEEPPSDRHDWVKIDDALAARLSELAHVEWLNVRERVFHERNHSFKAGQIRSPGSTGCGASQLRMRGLTLSGSGVTRSGLVHLKGMTQLDFLEFEGTANRRLWSREPLRPDKT